MKLCGNHQMIPCALGVTQGYVRLLLTKTTPCSLHCSHSRGSRETWSSPTATPTSSGPPERPWQAPPRGGARGTLRAPQQRPVAGRTTDCPKPVARRPTPTVAGGRHAPCGARVVFRVRGGRGCGGIGTHALSPSPPPPSAASPPRKRRQRPATHSRSPPWL